MVTESGYEPFCFAVVSPVFHPTGMTVLDYLLVAGGCQQRIATDPCGRQGLVARLHTHLLNILAGLATIAAPNTATM